MATRTATVTVNPAFLQELKQDNHELWHLLHETRRFCLGSCLLPVSRKRLFALVSQLRDRLAMHFSLEETYGYFEDAVAAAPRLSHRAEQLRNQHQELLGQLCGVVEGAEHLVNGQSDAPSRRQVATLFADFYHALQQHEMEEGDLIVDALETDLGCGD